MPFKQHAALHHMRRQAISSYRDECKALDNDSRMQDSAGIKQVGICPCMYNASCGFKQGARGVTASAHTTAPWLYCLLASRMCHDACSMPHVMRAAHASRFVRAESNPTTRINRRRALPCCTRPTAPHAVPGCGDSGAEPDAPEPVQVGRGGRRGDDGVQGGEARAARAWHGSLARRHASRPWVARAAMTRTHGRRRLASGPGPCPVTEGGLRGRGMCGMDCSRGRCIAGAGSFCAKTQCLQAVFLPSCWHNCGQCVLDVRHGCAVLPTYLMRAAAGPRTAAEHGNGGTPVPALQGMAGPHTSRWAQL